MGEGEQLELNGGCGGGGTFVDVYDLATETGAHLFLFLFAMFL